MPDITTQNEPGSTALEFMKGPIGPTSYDAGVLIAGQNLLAGTVLGRITASGKYTILAPAAVDGSQNAAAILGYPMDATAGDRPVMVVTCLTDVAESMLTWPVGITAPQRTTARTQLAALNIKCR